MDRTITLRELIDALKLNGVDEPDKVGRFIFFTAELSRVPDEFKIRFSGPS